MAHIHYKYPTTFFSLYLNDNRKSSYTRRDIDFYNDQNFFDYLLEKSILTKNELLNMSLRGQEGYLFVNQSLYPPHQIRRLVDKRTHYGLMYCPKCLKEDKTPYWRKKWRYFFYTACPKHKIFLTDRCWHCYKPIKLLRIKLNNKINYCSNCGADLSLTETYQDVLPNEYGLEAIKWFEEGLQKGYFEINDQKIWSAMFFHIFCKLSSVLDRKENLKLTNFSMLNNYHEICKKLKIYNSKKSSTIYKSFYLNSMIYHLFQNFPNNFQDFIVLNKLTYREFTHGLNYMPFWYENLISELVPKQNKIGREISQSEVLGAIKYLEHIDERVNLINVAQIVGCHATIHKGFNKIYKSLKKL
ncbi:TniQ family protein [Aliarcobacter butzleri]|nr:TniQ family protein [Aliarcobacter butzleri]